MVKKIGKKAFKRIVQILEKHQKIRGMVAIGCLLCAVSLLAFFNAKNMITMIVLIPIALLMALANHIYKMKGKGIK